MSKQKNKRLSAQQLENVRHLIDTLEYPLKLEAWATKARAFMLAFQDTLGNPARARLLGDLCDELEKLLPEQDHE